jgi:putative addiction module component (TIGR02574 family)
MASHAFDFDALRRLSVDERLRLVEGLWDGIAQDAPDEALPMTPELAAELDRRHVDHEANPDDVVAWDDVRARLLGG